MHRTTAILLALLAVGCAPSSGTTVPDDDLIAAVQSDLDAVEERFDRNGSIGDRHVQCGPGFAGDYPNSQLAVTAVFDVADRADGRRLVDQIAQMWTTTGLDVTTSQATKNMSAVGTLHHVQEPEPPRTVSLVDDNAWSPNPAPAWQVEVSARGRCR